MIIQKTKVKKMFNQQKLQITNDALNQIDDYIFRVLYNKTVKAKQGNIKRVTPELLHLIGVHI
tara:strand:- start:723 stop:911 length:189 start_codon:yes stop_codon:yes gene_type:complete